MNTLTILMTRRTVLNIILVYDRETVQVLNNNNNNNNNNNKVMSGVAKVFGPRIAYRGEFLWRTTQILNEIV
jgi:hypothetical protein